MNLHVRMKRFNIILCIVFTLLNHSVFWNFLPVSNGFWKCFNLQN